MRAARNSREYLWDADERWGPWGLGVMICGRIAMRAWASGEGGNRREHRWAMSPEGKGPRERRYSPAFQCDLAGKKGGAVLFHLDDFVDD
jgi:hypothetical protein